MRLLILGGTTEASILARRIADRRGLDPVMSFAGRTRTPAPPPIPFRVGGFGGIAGLKAYLTGHRVNAVIDATHPFAVRMSGNAVAACRDLGLPLAVLTRPAWSPREGDHWTGVAGTRAAVHALAGPRRNVFLTIGGLQLAEFASAPQHQYLVRTVDHPDSLASLPFHCLILARGPFSVEGEIALMRDNHIEVLVTKNSGGSATEAKLEAARVLGVRVIMIERPVSHAAFAFIHVEDILDWIEVHRAPP